ncbi:hypothetical protein TB2_030794 [Malus domestica]
MRSAPSGSVTCCSGWTRLISSAALVPPERLSRAAAEQILQTYNGTFMPNTEQNFRLNRATLGADERRQDDGPDFTVFVGDLAADLPSALTVGLKVLPSLCLPPIRPGVAAASLKTICLKELYNGQCFGPLIIGAKKLRTLKLFRCSGDWDKLLQVISERVTSMVETHLEKLQVSDVGLTTISNCLDLEILHLVKTPECTNVGLVSVAERCKLLRKLHIDGWKANRVGDEGLVSVAKNCANLHKKKVSVSSEPKKKHLHINNSILHKHWYWLAAAHVALKQDLAAAQHDLRRSSVVTGTTSVIHLRPLASNFITILVTFSEQ